MITTTCPCCKLIIAIPAASIEAGARAVMNRLATRRNSALQLVTNLPIPPSLIDDVGAAIGAALAAPTAAEQPATPDHDGPHG